MRGRGTLPLVIALDNSGPGRSQQVRAWLHANAVVALFNVPHVPQHNAGATLINNGRGSRSCMLRDRNLGECRGLVGPGLSPAPLGCPWSVGFEAMAKLSPTVVASDAKAWRAKACVRFVGRARRTSFTIRRASSRCREHDHRRHPHSTLPVRRLPRRSRAATTACRASRFVQDSTRSPAANALQALRALIRGDARHALSSNEALANGVRCRDRFVH